VAEYQDRLKKLKVLTRITSHRDWFMKEAIQFQLHPDTLIILTLDDGRVSEALDMNLNFMWLIAQEDFIAYCRTFRVCGCEE